MRSRAGVELMNNDNLNTYLNDHLAGSVAAVELLEHLESTAPDPQARNFYAALRAEVTEDQETLRGLLRRSGGAESRLRKATAWLGEKIGRMKLRLDDASGRELDRLEALEALALGIQGKLALWRALSAAAAQVPWASEVDLSLLERRARDQHERVELRRLEAARAAFDR